MSVGRINALNGDPTTILIIDDDPAILALLEAILGSIGYGVFSANNGADGLEILVSHQPDAIIVNETMPGMTGSEVILTVRSDPNYADLPVVLSSAGDVARDSAYLRQVGASAGLPKPYRRQDVADLLSSLNVPPSS